MKKMFPDHANAIVYDPGIRTIFDALKQADAEGYSSINIVVGSDRQKEFENLANKYNGQLYNFDAVNVISAGERDPDSEGGGGHVCFQTSVIQPQTVTLKPLRMDCLRRQRVW